MHLAHAIYLSIIYNTKTVVRLIIWVDSFTYNGTVVINNMI